MTSLSGSRIPCVAAVLTLVLASDTSAQSTRLSGALPDGADVHRFALDPSGTIAVYAADQDQAGVIELYAVSVDAGTPPVRISGALPAFGDVWLAAEAPFLVGAAGRVAYRADAAVDGAIELYGAPLDGGAPPVRLCAPLAAGSAVVAVALAPDGTRVVYAADQDVPGVRELFVAPLDGSASALRLHPASSDEDVEQCWIEPSGAHVLFTATRPASEGLREHAFRRVPIDGAAAPVELAARVLEDGSAGVASVALSPDGAWVAYLTRSLVDNEPRADLDLVPVDASAPPRRLVTSRATQFRFTPAGRLVHSVGSQFTGPPAHALLSTTPAGPATPLDDATPGHLSAWELDPADDTVFFFQDGDGLFAAPADGASAPVLLAALAGTCRGLRLLPDGTRVVLVVQAAGADRLLAVPKAGGPALELAPPGPSGALRAFQPDAGSTAVVLERVPSGAPRELFVATLDGRAPRRLHDPLPPGGTCGANGVGAPFSLTGTPAGEAAVYRATEEESGVFELYRAPLERERRRAAARPTVTVTR